jgi:3',5'-cyclic-AMP phosphodiesterase
VIIAQLSDLHLSATPLDGHIDTGAMFGEAIATVLALDPQPNAVWLTGDLVNLGTPQEYALLRERLAPLRMPVYVIPGNHDDRAQMRAAFSDHAYLPQRGEFLHYVIETQSLRLIALDTVKPGTAGGELCEARLAWLEHSLSQRPASPVMIFMHHPPFRTGIQFMDAIGLENPDRFAAVVERHRQIESIVCGHVHRSAHTRFAGTIAVVCPSTAHQIALDLRQPGQGAYIMEAPGFMLHVWDGERLVSHSVPIDNGARRRVFKP